MLAFADGRRYGKQVGQGWQEVESELVPSFPASNGGGGCSSGMRSSDFDPGPHSHLFMF